MSDSPNFIATKAKKSLLYLCRLVIGYIDEAVSKQRCTSGKYSPQGTDRESVRDGQKVRT